MLAGDSGLEMRISTLHVRGWPYHYHILTRRWSQHVSKRDVPWQLHRNAMLGAGHWDQWSWRNRWCCCICLSLFLTNASAHSARSSFFRFVINCDHCHSPRDQWRQQGDLIGPGWASNFASCRCSRWAWHDAKKDIPEQAKTVSEALACYMWRIVKTFRTHVHPSNDAGPAFEKELKIGQIFSPWRLHLWDTHKATAAVTLPPQPSGGTHQMIRGLFMHRSSSSTDPWVSIRAI